MADKKPRRVRIHSYTQHRKGKVVTVRGHLRRRRGAR